MSPESKYLVCDASPGEFAEAGQLMVKVYSNLKGFPTPKEQPKYYEMLANVGSLTNNSETRLLIALDTNDHITGAVVYFGDMQYYGSGGTATLEKDSAGFRLLAVDPNYQGMGIGRLLTEKCIDLAREQKLKQVIIHSTESMKVAWGLYGRMGFKRSTDLDFMQDQLPVFGFRLKL